MEEQVAQQNEGDQKAEKPSEAREARASVILALAVPACAMVIFFVGGLLLHAHNLVFFSMSFLFILYPLMAISGFIYGILGVMRGPRKLLALTGIILNIGIMLFYLNFVLDFMSSNRQ